MGVHTVQITGREALAVTGVTEVARFEEDAVVLETEMGQLLVQGDGLQLKELSAEGGRVSVTGHITALAYTEPRQGGSWLRRLLG